MIYNSDLFETHNSIMSDSYGDPHYEEEEADARVENSQNLTTASTMKNSIASTKNRKEIFTYKGI